ncbi:hypothetical protein LIER_11395 [Lithospermum erythrorhizon]|uniref:Uncharacterized protein n=1 Tax=Lithospermum erythrorhizon TaxID=34254 RepID=A0AAV3PPP3_LITER
MDSSSSILAVSHLVLNGWSLDILTLAVPSYAVWRISHASLAIVEISTIKQSRLNVLDLGFFRAIQSLQYKEETRNVDELVATVVPHSCIVSSKCTENKCNNSYFIYNHIALLYIDTFTSDFHQENNIAISVRSKDE